MTGEYGWAGAIMRWLRAVAALIVVNLLTVAGVVVGLGVFGVLPAARAATLALTAVRDGQSDGYARRFVRSYRRDFFRANRRGAPFVVVGVLLVLDTAVLGAAGDGPVVAALTALTSGVGVAGILVFAAWCAVETRYDDRAGSALRYALVLPFVSPVMSVALVIALAAVATALVLLPPLLPLVGLSVPLFVATWFVDHRLSQLDPQHPRAAARPASVLS